MSVDTPVLDCEELRFGPFAVPPFAARAGEVVRLLFQENSFDASDARTQLLDALAKAGSTGRIRAPGGIAVVKTATQRRGIAEFFHWQTTSEWLEQRTGLSRSESLEKLAHVPVDPTAPLCAMAGNPRTLLGLLAAFSTTASVVVLQTSGVCDPMGVQSVLSTLFDGLGNRAAVYVASPIDEQWPEIVFHKSLNVVRAAKENSRRAAG